MADSDLEFSRRRRGGGGGGGGGVHLLALFFSLP